MTIAIIIGVLLLALAPLFWAMPSRRERELARLRESARKLGYTLQVTEVDHPAPAAEQRVSSGNQLRRPMQACVAYRLPRVTNDASPPTPRTRVHRRADARAHDLPVGWVLDAAFDLPDAALNACLPSLGDDVLALESTPSSVAVFWTERGGEERLTVLTAMLRGLMSAQSQN